MRPRSGHRAATAAWLAVSRIAAIGQTKRPRHARHRRVRDDAGAGHAPRHRSIRKREPVAVGFDAHRQRHRLPAFVQHRVERDHSETSTSKRSLTSEPVAVPAAPGAAAKASSDAAPTIISFSAR